jgi:putative tricarboxylic transport membrane protein
MRNAVIIIGTVSVLLGILYLAEGVRYTFGTIAHPGPGFYPTFIGILLIIVGAGTGLEGILRKSDHNVEWPTGIARRRVVIITIAFMGYICLLPYIGYPVGATLLNLVILYEMGLSRWSLKFGLALILGVGSYYLFTILLGVPLPKGIWLLN